MDALSRIELLGGLVVRQGERVITRFRTQKAAALLAYLAYHLDQAHPREVLAELLWPWAHPATGRNNLRAELASLRRQLEPPGVPSGAVLKADRFSAQLNPATVTTDVAEFRAALVAAAAASSSTDRAQGLEEAVSLYRGPLLPGHYEDWVLVEQRGLAELYFQAVRQLTEHLAGSGDVKAALKWARQAVVADPLREEAQQDVIRLLVAAGQKTAALRQYRELEKALRAELGEEPSPETRRLIGRLLAVPDEHGAAAKAPSRRPRPPRTTGVGGLPTGTVTFLMTDIEGSTALWEQGGEAFRSALESHHALLRRSFRRHGGHEVKEAGDSFVVAFASAGDATACAVECQRALTQQEWPPAIGPLRVRMAVHTGDVALTEGEYQGLVLHRAARILTAAHGGQILCSEAIATLVRRDLEAGVRLADLGPYRLRDVPTPERLFQLDYPEMPQREFPPLRAEAGYAGNLPLQFTRFFGREPEMERLTAMLLGGQVRLVTLTGPGGCGKTRLAVEAARESLDAFQGAVWFVLLGGLSDPSLIGSAILEALRVPASPQLESLEQAAQALSRQRSLLVLDNFEHLVDGGAPLVRTLLERVPALTCLVTSRHCLHLRGEREFPVAPLPTPRGEEAADELVSYPSVGLFVDRAQATRPDFQVTATNAPVVAELCQRLEGIPLALELAAARAQVLTPSQMLAQLEHRFDFLVSRARDVEERHRTLRTAIEWSYQLLPSELQRFFVRLSIFRGGCTLQAAEAICGEVSVFDAVLDLCSHSLLHSQEVDTTARYQMLESIREFAREMLAPDAEGGLRTRHAQYFLGLAQDCAAGADGPREAEAFAQLDGDLANVRAAMDWAVERQEHGWVVQFGAALADFLWRRGYWQEHGERVGCALEAARKGPRTDRALIARLLHGLARVANDRGELADGEALCRRGLQMARQASDPQWQGIFLNLRALILRKRGHGDKARQALEESIPLFREARYPRGEGMALHNLGLVAGSAGDRKAARELYERALPIRERAGDVRGVAETQNNLGVLAEEEGQFGAAERAYREALRSLVKLGDVLWVAVSLCNLGELALRAGRHEEAARLLRAAEHALRHLGSVHADHASECLAQAASALDETPEPAYPDWRRELFAAAEWALQR